MAILYCAPLASLCNYFIQQPQASSLQKAADSSQPVKTIEHCLRVMPVTKKAPV